MRKESSARTKTKRTQKERKGKKKRKKKAGCNKETHPPPSRKGGQDPIPAMRETNHKASKCLASRADLVQRW